MITHNSGHGLSVQFLEMISLKIKSHLTHLQDFSILFTEEVVILFPYCVQCMITISNKISIHKISHHTSYIQQVYNSTNLE